jgi:predicted nucleotidyltransferase
MKIKLFNVLDIFKKKKADATLQTKFEELENINPYISKNVISIEKYKLKKAVQNG